MTVRTAPVRRAFSGLLLLAGVVMSEYPAWAGGLGDEPVGFRIGLAIDRASAFTDVVGLSASTAYPYGSSVNPASDDYLREPPNAFTWAFTTTGDYVHFDHGASLTAAAASASYRWEKAGTFSVSYTRFDSHDAKSHQGDGYGLHSNEVDLGYAYRFLKNLAIGVEVRLNSSTTNISGTFADLPLRTETDSQGIDVRVGTLIGLGEHWLLGLFAGGGTARTHTTGDLITPDPPFGVGAMRFRISDEVTNENFRLGLGWRPSDALGVYADIQYLKLQGHTNVTDVERGYLGVEYMPMQAIALRVGTSVDSFGSVSASTGVGIYAIKQVQTELAYVYNAFPEVRREFGAAHLFSVSVVVPF
jgi:hypothetical protein